MSLRPQASDIKPPGFPLATDGSAELKWADLSETEKSAASLGVHPEAWKPIEFMNTAHHETLLKANALDSDLAKKLEAFKAVAAGVTAQ
jgi:hypothetical protein